MWLAAVARPACPANVIHKTLWGYFPDVADGDPRPFLYRELGERIALLSRIPPACPAAALGERIHAGRVYQFDVLASPRNGHNQHKGHRFIRDNGERRAWFGRRLTGAAPTFVHVYDRPDVHIGRGRGQAITRPACRISGTVRVTDRAAFLDCLLRGIGGGGAWGFGLLVLPEVMACSR